MKTDPLKLVKLSDHDLSDLLVRAKEESRRRATMAVDGKDALTIIRGNELAKRALTVAAAGGHSILFVGPHASGKTMLRAAALALGLGETYEWLPCPCGNRGSCRSACHCTVRQIQRHLVKVPVAEINVEVCELSFREWDSENAGTGLAEMRAAIHAMGKIPTVVSEFATELLKYAVQELGCDRRQVESCQRIAATIAALDNSIAVLPEHMSEAINYRTLLTRV